MTWFPIRSFARLATLLMATLFLIVWPQVAHAATIVVDTTAPAIVSDNDCSLREAIIAANTNSNAIEDDCVAGDDSPVDTIVLGISATYVITDSYANYTGLTGLPSITSIVAISGNSSTIQRNSGTAFRFFYVESPSGDLTIDDLTVTNGAIAGNGAAFLIDGKLTVVDSYVFSNTATGFGGAILNDEGTLTLVDSTLSDNQAGFGGALSTRNSSITTMTNTQILSNTASASGGGLYNEDLSVVTLFDSTMISNVASDGAGLYNVDTGTITATNTQILFNLATGGGGGINNTAGSTLTLRDSRLEGNVASIGGGLYNDTASIANLTNTYVVSNTATDRGGGLYNRDGSTATITNSFILSNTAAVFGGGLFNTISAPIVITGTDIVGNNADNAGGGVYQEGGLISITNSRLLNNNAGENGGAIGYATTDLTVSQSCIVGNSFLAVYSFDELAIDADNNWWGASNGPSGSGAGAGDGAGQNVDFTPFLTSAILGCPTKTADVELAKSVTPVGDLLPGQPITYTVTITNTGAEDVYNVVVVDPMPAAYQPTQNTLTTGPVFITFGDSYTIPVLGPSEVATIQFAGKIVPAIVSEQAVLNTATINHLLAGQLEASTTNNIVVPRIVWSSATYNGVEGNEGTTLQVQLQLVPPTPYNTVFVNSTITDGDGIDSDLHIFLSGTSTITIDLNAARDGKIGPRVITLSLDSPEFALLGTPSNATATLVDTDFLGLEIYKGVSSLNGYLNQFITYTYAITNTGTVDLSLDASDDLLGTFSEFDFTIEPQETLTATRAENLSDEVYEPGPLVNIFSVTGTDSDDNSISRSATVTITVGITGETGLELSILPSASEIRLGELITYTYLVTNTGTLELSDLTLEDITFGSGFSRGTLDPGSTYGPSFTRTIREENLPGPLVNTAVLTATNPLGESITVTATASVSIIPYDTSLPFVERTDEE